MRSYAAVCALMNCVSIYLEGVSRQEETSIGGS